MKGVSMEDSAIGGLTRPRAIRDTGSSKWSNVRDGIIYKLLTFRFRGLCRFRSGFRC